MYCLKIPRKRQFIFISHTTTKTSVVCYAKYFVKCTQSKMKNTLNELNVNIACISFPDFDWFISQPLSSLIDKSSKSYSLEQNHRWFKFFPLRNWAAWTIQKAIIVYIDVKSLNSAFPVCLEGEGHRGRGFCIDWHHTPPWQWKNLSERMNPLHFNTKTDREAQNDMFD